MGMGRERDKRGRADGGWEDRRGAVRLTGAELTSGLAVASPLP